MTNIATSGCKKQEMKKKNMEKALKYFTFNFSVFDDAKKLFPYILLMMNYDDEVYLYYIY